LFLFSPEITLKQNLLKPIPMFNKDRGNTAEKFGAGSATLISTGTVVHGDLKSEMDLRIDGTIHGNVTSSAKIIVGPEGLVEGAIQGAQADIAGRVVGNIVVNDLAQMRTKSNVQGNITALSLQIEAGATFNGQSIMATAAAGNVVQMKDGETVHAKAN
jgi:cytoskeletal protein CcmA (bactofilin family)